MENKESSEATKKPIKNRFGDVLATTIREIDSKTIDAPIISVTRRWDRDNVIWVLIWSFSVIILCIAAYFMVLETRSWTLDAEDMSTLEIFVSVFGLAYAIVVGLLIVEAHGRFHELSSTFLDELNAVSDIYDCLEYFDDCDQNKRAKKNITTLLLRYIGDVKKYEWKLMRGIRSGLNNAKASMRQYNPEYERYFHKMLKEYKVKKYKEIFKDYGMWKGKRSKDESDTLWRSRIQPIIEFMCEEYQRLNKYEVQEYGRINPFKVRDMHGIVEAVGKLKSSNEITCYAQQTIIEKICDLTSRRTNRIELAKNGIKGYLKAFIIFMSLVIAGGTLFLNVAEDWLHLFIVFTTVAGLVGLYAVFQDMDTPFSGIWELDKKILDAIMTKLAADDEELLKVKNEYEEIVPTGIGA